MPENDSTSPIHAMRRRRGQRMTTEERKQAQEVFIKVFASTANVRAACMKAGIDRSQIYRWQEHDESFAQRFRAASLEADDAIRAEIWRRGIQGVEEPVISMGNLVYEYEPVLNPDGTPKLDAKGKPIMKRGARLTVRKYSDGLLTLLAKARMPEFRDKVQTEMSGPNGEPLQGIQAIFYLPRVEHEEGYSG